MKKESILYFFAGVGLFLIADVCCFPERGIKSFVALNIIFFLAGLIATFIGTLSLWQRAIFLLFPFQLFLFISTITYFAYYPNSTINIYGIIEYIPASFLSLFIGLWFGYLIKASIYKIAIPILFLWLITIFSITSFLPDYYFYFYTLRQANKQFKYENFKLTKLDTSKKLLQPNDLKNKVLLMEFWTTRCGSCVSQLRELKNIVHRFQNNQDVEILAINTAQIDSYERANEFKKIQLLKNEINLFYDEKAKLSNQMDVSGVPNLWLIDKKGNIRYQITGYFDNSNFTDNISYQINKLINE